MPIATFRKHRVLLAAGVLLLAGCSASRPDAQAPVTIRPDSGATPSITAPPASGNQVAIDGFAFAPATLTVRAGTTVTWINRDEEPHTVAASDGSFHSPGMGTGASFTHTFSTAGTFDYVCSIHPMMHGTVVVTQ
ncbi:cupredoxin domain-containing protein [Mycobacterium sp. Aquia_213]|uniref:cupredoxin domain-containing protein n=1 Tax=Mycobacterium sp. Aquia_213 TaxID=2991728 RepID=UPI00226F878B|nr:cupredoxin family copper-binding protein [Mycobacterium sp. Aquia_213]WAC90715.1 cupredoxin family copper-binding protein [Mycobacterium sp. Aquia_213]